MPGRLDDPLKSMLHGPPLGTTAGIDETLMQRFPRSKW
jgi:hypothetical protein